MKIVVANWKMNPQSIREAEGIFKNIRKKTLKLKKTKVIVCAPTIYINKLNSLCKKSIFVGAQDFFDQEKGSWTGKVSSNMLRNLGVDFTLLGHSEIRQLGETEEDLNQKIKLALKNKIKPIICIGENVRDDDGNYFSILEGQLLSALKGIGGIFSGKIIIAYEPVWAVGKASKKIIKSEDLLQITLFIKKILMDKYGAEKLKKIKILYGGSVNPINTEDLIQNGGVDGFLVGRDSLVSENFNKIVHIVENN